MNINTYKKFKQAESYLESMSNLTLVNFFAGTSNPGHHFGRAKHLLKLAGNPDKKLKIIHIAGTSGKGTTTNLIYNILQKAGYKVGAHFSPFVSVATEKIQINNKLISAQEFTKLVDEIRPIVKKCYQTYDAPSYFEMWLVLALKYFEKQKCDYVVLETGCGGRYDGTNAVAKTECSVITNIGLDHTHILGKTYEKIAYEKAGIIRSKGQVFTATDNPKALKVIQKVAEQQKATLDIYENQEKPNEALARAVADYLEIKEAKIAEGIKAAKLPCRFEIVKQKPIIILDGAHNPDKIAYLAEKYKAKYENRKLHLICALGAYKDPKKTFKALMPFVKKAYCTRFTTPQRKVTPPLELVKAFDRKPTEMNLDPQNALRSALRQATQNDIILVTGSFFLCGELRNNWLSEDWQLENRKSFK